METLAAVSSVDHSSPSHSPSLETPAASSPSDSAEEEASAAAAAAAGHESRGREKRRKLLGGADADADALPPDDVIMYEIVARLPATTALRLRRVSKAWDAAIRSRGFSERQSSHAVCRRVPDAVVLICDVYPGGLQDLYLVDLATQSTSFGPGTSLSLEVRLGCCRSGMEGYNLVGACEGLVCFCHDHRLLVINPITGETLRLSTSAAARALHTPNYHSEYILCGFGFDLDREEYKIVRILFDESAGEAVRTEVCAFNLNELQAQHDDGSDGNNDSERRWRRTGSLPTEVSRHPSGAAFVNGNFHWLIRNVSPSHQILAFNFRDERFRTLPVPPEAGLKDFWQLAELGGRLAYMDRRGCRLVVWIMDEYGRGDSWRHAFDLLVSSGRSDEWLPYVFGYWKGDTDKVLMRAGRRLWLYDLRTERKQPIALRLPPSSSEPNNAPSSSQPYYVHDISFVIGRLL